jgi:hypothetical protein
MRPKNFDAETAKEAEKVSKNFYGLAKVMGQLLRRCSHIAE